MGHDAGTARADESRLSRVERGLHESIHVIERILTGGVAVALVVLAVMALWNTVVLVSDEVRVRDLTRAVTVGVDTVFLTVILLELLHTMVAPERLARQAADFIVIGITSAIRHGLSLVATSSGAGETVTRVIHGKVYKVSVPGGANPRDIVVNLAINSGGVLLLVLALWIVRHSFPAGAEDVER